MSDKYYLVRQRHEHLLGPYNLAEIDDLYRQGRCELNDEVSGNLGPWLYLRERGNLKHYYPELAAIFHTAENKEHLVSSYDKYDSPKQRSAISSSVFIIAILLIGGAIGAAIYLGRFYDDHILAQVTQAYQRQNYQQAVEILATNDRLVERLINEVSISPQWLPILRSYAFLVDGNLTRSLIATVYDQTAIETPTDCTVARWRKIWQESVNDWEQFIGKQQLIDRHWSRLLSWDPHWLRTKSSPSWRHPKSYEQGCFLAAHKAFIALSLPNNSNFTIIRERIMWQAKYLNAVSNGREIIYPRGKVNPVLIWNCMEQSIDLRTLDNCRRIIRTAPQTQLVVYSQEKYLWNKLRIIETQLRNDPSSTTKKASSFSATKSNDSYNGINYRETLDYLAGNGSNNN